MVLKRELARRAWAIDAFVGAVFKRRGGDSLGMGRGFNSAPIFDRISRSKSFQFLPRSHHDRATIAPRSGHDRASIVILELCRSSSARVESIPRQKACDREVLPQHLCTVRCESREPSDVDQVSRPISIDFDQLAAAV